MNNTRDMLHTYLFRLPYLITFINIQIKTTPGDFVLFYKSVGYSQTYTFACDNQPFCNIGRPLRTTMPSLTSKCWIFMRKIWSQART